MIDFAAPANEVFQILRSYDYEVLLYDEDGNQCFEPDDARRMFAEPSNLFVSLTDQGDDSAIHMHISNKVTPEDILGLI